MAAIDKSFVLLVPATLCILVVLAAAQGNTVALIVTGEARCKYNTSAVISNSTLQLMINGSIVPDSAGTTTSTGQVMMTVNLTSPGQVESLTSNSSQVLVVARPDACGVPSLPANSVVAANLQVSDPQLINPTDDDTPAQVTIGGDANILPSHPMRVISAKLAGKFSCVVVTGGLFA